jgi:Protein of unknown function (DUF1566)/Carboxypeptidase regulatory-like domain
LDRIKLLSALVGLGLLTSCGGGAGGSGLVNFPAPSATASVSGTVTFKGNPLPGATVTAWVTNTNSVFQTATTDSNGNYSFSGMDASAEAPEELQISVSKAGYGFYPAPGGNARVTGADFTGQFMGNGITDVAIHFTVIDYKAAPTASLSGANFHAYDGSNRRVAVPRTGQTISYASGDDGSLRKGAAWPGPRFADNQDGTVTDNLTGLIWLQNAGCFPPAIWSTALAEVNQLASGACGLNDGSSAGQWRLPNLNELESMVDVSAANPVVSVSSLFLNVSNGIYWSSTSYFGGQGGSPNAWSIRFSDGRYMNDSSSNAKATANNAVWAVKGRSGGAVKLQSTGMYVVYTRGDDGTFQAGVPPTYPRWIDNRNGTITDTVTGLIWLKQADCINQPWLAAVAAVNTLGSGRCGLTDGSAAGSWRMPNRNEMQSLSDRMVNNHADFFDQTYIMKAMPQTVYQAPIFTNFVVSEYYWTSTTNAADTTEAWTVFSNDFGVYDISKTQSGYTLAVR